MSLGCTILSEIFYNMVNVYGITMKNNFWLLAVYNIVTCFAKSGLPLHESVFHIPLVDLDNRSRESWCPKKKLPLMISVIHEMFIIVNIYFMKKRKVYFFIMVGLQFFNKITDETKDTKLLQKWTLRPMRYAKW
jgi:hypothetical protein